MNPWRPYPLIRLVFAFIAGILAAILHLFCFEVPVLLITGACAFVVLLSVFPAILSSYKLRWIRGVAVFSVIALMGNQLVIETHPGYFYSQGEAIAGKKGIFAARVCDQPARKAKTVRATAEIFIWDSSTVSFRYVGQVLLYLQKNLDSERMKYGDLLMVGGTTDSLSTAGTPGGFDMRKYYARKEIFLQMYLPTGKWRPCSGGVSFSVRRTAGLLRDRLLTIFRENKVEGEEFAVAAALLLGYVSEIDKELLNDYSSSGAMHILSVSGMHVGVIYLFLEFLLGFLGKRRRTNRIATWLKAVLMVTSIWSYALLTGLSPPVERAAIMLSMVIIGKNLQRQPEILNILAASLFIILLSDPFLILDLGCQFSYLAVAGIVLLYKPVYDLYVTSRWLPDKIWSLVAVSISAQLVTFPLGLFVFHQFPNYFLLTNILAVPLSSVIIYAGILLLALGSVTWIGPLMGQALSFLVWLLNQIVRMIDAMPGSTLKGIFLSMPEMLLLYVMTLCMFLFFLKKKKFWFFLLLLSVVLFAASKFEQRVTNTKRGEIVVYNGKTTMVDFISGDRQFLLMQNPLKSPDDYTRSSLLNHWASKGVVHRFSGYLIPPLADPAFRRSSVTISGLVTRYGNFFLFRGRRIAILDRPLYGKPDKPLNVDVLIICKGVRMKKDDLMKFFNAGRTLEPENSGYILLRLP